MVDKRMDKHWEWQIHFKAKQCDMRLYKRHSNSFNNFERNRTTHNITKQVVILQNQFEKGVSVHMFHKWRWNVSHIWKIEKMKLVTKTNVWTTVWITIYMWRTLIHNYNLSPASAGECEVTISTCLYLKVGVLHCGMRINK